MSRFKKGDKVIVARGGVIGRYNNGDIGEVDNIGKKGVWVVFDIHNTGNVKRRYINSNKLELYKNNKREIENCKNNVEQHPLESIRDKIYGRQEHKNRIEREKKLGIHYV